MHFLGTESLANVVHSGCLRYITENWIEPTTLPRRLGLTAQLNRVFWIVIVTYIKCFAQFRLRFQPCKNPTSCTLRRSVSLSNGWTTPFDSITNAIHSINCWGLRDVSCNQKCRHIEFNLWSSHIKHCDDVLTPRHLRRRKKVDNPIIRGHSQHLYTLFFFSLFSLFFFRKRAASLLHWSITSFYLCFFLISLLSLLFPFLFFFLWTEERELLALPHGASRVFLFLHFFFSFYFSFFLHFKTKIEEGKKKRAYSSLTEYHDIF